MGNPPRRRVFKSGGKIAIIFANGELEHPELIADKYPADVFMIAADGGFRHMALMGWMPHILIGDLDSVSSEEVYRAEAAGCEVLRFPPEKDETDLELALTQAVKRGYEQIIIVAGLGGRLDQTLANITLLNLPMLSGCDVRLDDGIEEVFLVRPIQSIEGQPGDTVSLLPISPVVEGIRTTGLKYPLVNENLSNFRSRGISNVMTERNATIEFKKGTLLCIHRRERNIK